MKTTINTNKPIPTPGENEIPKWEDSQIYSWVNEGTEETFTGTVSEIAEHTKITYDYLGYVRDRRPEFMRLVRGVYQKTEDLWKLSLE